MADNPRSYFCIAVRTAMGLPILTWQLNKSEVESWLNFREAHSDYQLVTSDNIFGYAAIDMEKRDILTYHIVDFNKLEEEGIDTYTTKKQVQSVLDNKIEVVLSIDDYLK